MNKDIDLNIYEQLREETADLKGILTAIYFLSFIFAIGLLLYKSLQ